MNRRSFLKAALALPAVAAVPALAAPEEFVGYSTYDEIYVGSNYSAYEVLNIEPTQYWVASELNDQFAELLALNIREAKERIAARVFQEGFPDE